MLLVDSQLKKKKKDEMNKWMNIEKFKDVSDILPPHLLYFSNFAFKTSSQNQLLFCSPTNFVFYSKVSAFQ